MTGTIGTASMAIDATVASFLEYKQSIMNDVSNFLNNWEKEYNLHQTKLKRQKLEESVQETNRSLGTSTRPSRCARLTAMENIKKQVAEQDNFLKPKAMPRLKAKKRLKEIEEIKTETAEVSSTSEFEVVLEKSAVSRTKARRKIKESKRVENDKSEIADCTPRDESVARELEIPEGNVTRASTRTKAKRKLKETAEVDAKKVDEIQITETDAAASEATPKVSEPEIIENLVTEIPEMPMIVDAPEKNVETSGSEVIVENISPAISPVPFPNGNTIVINETIDQSPDQTIDFESAKVSVFIEDKPKQKKFKGKKGLTSSGLIFNDHTVENDLNKTLTVKNTLQEKKKSEGKKQRETTTRLKRTKFRESRLNSTYDDFAPKAESSILNLDMERTRVLTPKNVNNGTFVVNASGKKSSPVDIFVEGLETVVRVKKPREEIVRAKIVAVKETPEEVEFQVPLPVASLKKNAVDEVCYDALGNVLDRETASRTKVITVPTFGVLPHATDGRPVRTRTKVRRLGVAEDGEKMTTLEHSNASETSQRVKRTKNKSIHETAAENIKEAKAIARKSKARRASQVLSKIALSKLPLSSAKKYKTPLSTVTNQLHGKRPMIVLHSATKDCPSSVKKNRFDEPAKLFNKPSEDQLNDEREAKIKSKIQKEETAALKKLEELNRRQEQLKQKNKEKLARAKECRAKIEEEKHEMIIQTEKEKEMKRKLAVLEREQKQRAEMNKKKLLAEKKLAENEERRRVEEEMRLAKIREIELEQQRQQQEKQRQIELDEKRTRERLEEKKKMLEAEKLMKLKMAQAARVEAEQSKKKKKYEGLYLPKTDNDLGLEDEMTEDSDEEEQEQPKRPLPNWVQPARKGTPLIRYLTSQQIGLFMPLRSKTPNVQQMFNLSPKRVLRRTSSAIWDKTFASPF